MNREVVYDTETYSNLLLYVFYDINTKEWFKFEISPYRDQRKELMIFLRDVTLMIGFNSLRFDYPILHYLFQILKKNFAISAKELLRLINLKVIEVIKSKFPEIRIPLIPQCNLYRIHHFDNVAKATSLKMLEFVFRMRNIEELPYHPNTFLTLEQRDKVVMYCRNDVFATDVTFKKSHEHIELRQRLSEIYSLPMANWNDPKIGEQILVKIIKEKLGVDSLGQTPRDKIDLSEIIFYYIGFSSPEFQAILKWFKQKIITETKKTFSEIPFDQLEELLPYMNSSKKNTVKGKIKTLNVIHKGFQYDFGTGGIHGSIQAGVYESTNDWLIWDIDVESYYPNLGIKGRLYPHHLTEIFCDIYEGIFLERRKYGKGTPENKGLKLALNGSYGKSNSKFSPLYDPQYTMSITINGQLLLCMLAEWLTTIPDLIMLQINTDGLTIKVNKCHEALVKDICSRWEAMTKLTLEHNFYSKMVIRDVNNYLAVKTTGGVKLKGAFEYEKELHKNHSMLIVPKAIKAFYADNIPVEQTILNGDMWDFFKRVKLNSGSKLVGRTESHEFTYGKITRYYVSNVGETLLKIMPPVKDKIEDREFNIEAGYLSTVANNVTDELLEEMKENVNYQYYINECNKIITAINLHQELDDNEDS